MTKAKTPFFSLGAHGTLGDTLTLQKRGTTQYARKKPVPTDPKSLPQIYQRWLYQDYIAWWHDQTAAVKQTWETNARRYHMTGFAYWMKDKLKDLEDISYGLHLDASGGSVAYDFSRNENHGAITGASVIDGTISNARRFDGLNDFINMGADPSLFPDTLTLCFDYRHWCRVEEGDVRSLTNYPNFLIELSANVIYYPGAANYRYHSASTPTNLRDLHWHRCALKIPGRGQYDARDSELWVDGQQQDLLAFNTGLPLWPKSTPVHIGQNVGNWLRADLDNIVQYNRLLTTEDILRIQGRRYP